MDTIRARQRNRWYLLVYLYMILVLFTLLVVASYTWFSLSQTPRVSDLYMFINAEPGLELSTTPDAEEWELQLDFREIVDATAPLRPITWSDQDECFYSLGYGIDGRPTNFWTELTDSRNANKNNLDGYYVKATFYARSGQPVAVSLSPAVEVGEDGTQGSGTYVIGYPVWNSSEVVHFDGGLGAQSAIRLGFRITPVDSSGAATGAGSEFIIYEPNIRRYSGDLAEADPKDDPEPENRGEVGEDGSDPAAPREDAALSEKETSDLVAQVPGYVPTPNIHGATDLVDESRMILQNGSWWKEAYPVQRDVLMYHLGDFVTDPYLFSLDKDDIVRIELYIWLEGQDVDCTNAINRAQILASIQFAMEPIGGSGLVPIPD